MTTQWRRRISSRCCLSELLWLFVVSFVVVVAATLTLATFGALAPLSWTTLWQILLHSVGLLKLPTNCPTTLPTRCLRQQQEEELRKEAVEEEGEEQEEGVAEQQPWKRFNFIFYSK